MIVKRKKLKKVEEKNLLFGGHEVEDEKEVNSTIIEGEEGPHLRTKTWV